MGVLDRILPVDENPDSLRRWRVCHALVAWGGLSLACVIATAALIGLPLIGALAWADKVDDKVDKKIEAAIAPLAKAQSEHGQQLDNIAAILKAQSVADLQRSMMLAKKEQCDARRENRSARYWTEELAKLRAKFRDLAGYDADVPTDCALI